MSLPSKSTVTKFERWVRITCPDKKCSAGTFIPAKGIPAVVVCVVCRKQVKTAGMVEQARR